LLRCNSVSNRNVTGERLIARVEISNERVYVVTGVVVAIAVLVVRAAVVPAVVRVAVVVVVVAVVVVVVVVVVESKLVPAVVMVRDTSNSFELLSSAAKSLIDVNVMYIIGCCLWLLM
jgi:hypothetical protein